MISEKQNNAIIGVKDPRRKRTKGEVLRVQAADIQALNRRTIERQREIMEANAT